MPEDSAYQSAHMIAYAGGFAPRLAPAIRRYHAGMYRVHKPGYDLAAVRAVVLAYRRERQAGQFDEPARETVH